MSRSVPTPRMPALLTSPSTPPKRAITAAKGVAGFRISNLLKRMFDILWIFLKGAKTYLGQRGIGPTETIDMTTNPNETATDAVNRTAQEILAAVEAKDSAKVTSYYAPDAVIATPGRPAAKDGRAVSKAIRDDIADPNFKISLSNEKTEVAGSGDLAYRHGPITRLMSPSGLGRRLKPFVFLNS